VITDGVWVWPEYLEYYVATYHVELPKAFVRHMEQSSWTAPPVTDEQLRGFYDEGRRKA
jgi:hypothetical protein